MTAKSVIQVDVDPEGNFAAFYEMYRQYEAHVEKAGETWKEFSDAIDDTEGPMEALLDLSGKNADAVTIAAYQANVIAKEIRAASTANLALLSGITRNTKAQKSFSDESERGNRALEKMRKNADGVAHSIFGIGKFLLKLGAIGGGLAGLGGLLSAISLKDLASSAVNTQKNARGLGMTPGQLTAFAQDYSRYVDESALGSIADAQNSFSGRMWLARASGVDARQVGSEDPGKLAGQLAIRAHDWWANTPEAMRTSENLQSSGFAQSGFSLAMMRQLGNTPLSELNRAAAQYGQDQGRFNVGDKNTDEWYGFLRQIKDAGNTIETDLKNKLVALSPDLQRFINVIGKDAKKLIDDVFTEKNLKSLELGIGAMTDYLGSSQFQQDIKDFAGLIGLVAEKIRAAAKFLGIDTSSVRSAQSQVPNVDPGLDPAEVQRETRGRIRDFGGISSSDKALGYTRHFLNMPHDPGRALASIEAQNGLPNGLLSEMWSTESTKGSKLVGPVLKNGDQAIGDFQFTSAAWKDWGKGGDRFNFNDESKAAGAYMANLMKRYGGDVRKALAAYNWGPGNVDKQVSSNGGNWQSGLPAETRKYLDKISSAVARRQPASVNVTVTNNTSARVAVQTNAAAIQ